MKKTTLVAIVLAAKLFTPLFVQAQGTLYVSNLGQTPMSTAPVASDFWLAVIFGTGNNPGGYDLNSVQLLMDAASGNPNGFSVSIFSTLGGRPQSNLGRLDGSTDPSAGGIFTYTASGLTLSPSTDYFVVLTAATPLAQGTYDWSIANTSGYSSSDNWVLGGGGGYSSNNGLSWSRIGMLQFAIYATPTPEPATYALAGLGLAALSFWRLRQTK